MGKPLLLREVHEFGETVAADATDIAVRPVKGAYVAEMKVAEELQADRFAVLPGDLIYNDMWARHGSVAVVGADLENCVASAHFPTWILDKTKVFAPYLTWCFRSPWFWSECELRSRGSTGRNAIRKGLFREIKIPLPGLDRQMEIHRYFEQQSKFISALIENYTNLRTMADAMMPSVLDQVLGQREA